MLHPRVVTMDWWPWPLAYGAAGHVASCVIPYDAGPSKQPAKLAPARTHRWGSRRQYLQKNHCRDKKNHWRDSGPVRLSSATVSQQHLWRSCDTRARDANQRLIIFSPLLTQRCSPVPCSLVFSAGQSADPCRALQLWWMQNPSHGIVEPRDTNSLRFGASQLHSSSWATQTPYDMSHGQEHRQTAWGHSPTRLYMICFCSCAWPRLPQLEPIPPWWFAINCWP